MSAFRADLRDVGALAGVQRRAEPRGSRVSAISESSPSPRFPLRSGTGRSSRARRPHRSDPNAQPGPALGAGPPSLTLTAVAPPATGSTVSVISVLLARAASICSTPRKSPFSIVAAAGPNDRARPVADAPMRPTAAHLTRTVIEAHRRASPSITRVWPTSGSGRRGGSSTSRTPPRTTSRVHLLRQAGGGRRRGEPDRPPRRALLRDPEPVPVHERAPDGRAVRARRRAARTSTPRRPSRR